MLYRTKTVAVLEQDGRITQKVFDDRIYLILLFGIVIVLLLEHNGIKVIDNIKNIKGVIL